MATYRVWGLTDDDCEPTVLYQTQNKKRAVAYAEKNPMAVSVENMRTDEEVWRPEFLVVDIW